MKVGEIMKNKFKISTLLLAGIVFCISHTITAKAEILQTNEVSLEVSTAMDSTTGPIYRLDPNIQSITLSSMYGHKTTLYMIDKSGDLHSVYSVTGVTPPSGGNPNPTNETYIVTDEDKQNYPYFKLYAENKDNTAGSFTSSTNITMISPWNDTNTYKTSYCINNNLCEWVDGGNNSTYHYYINSWSFPVTTVDLTHYERYSLPNDLRPYTATASGANYSFHIRLQPVGGGDDVYITTPWYRDSDSSSLFTVDPATNTRIFASDIRKDGDISDLKGKYRVIFEVDAIGAHAKGVPYDSYDFLCGGIYLYGPQTPYFSGFEARSDLTTVFDLFGDQ